MTHDILPVSKINWGQTIPWKEPNSPDDDWEYPKKNKKKEYYLLVPKAPDGFIKVMRVKPPEFVKEYATVKGPFNSKKALKNHLDKLKIPDGQRPVGYRNTEEEQDWSYHV